MTSEGLQLNYDAASFTSKKTGRHLVWHNCVINTLRLNKQKIDKSTNLDFQIKKLRLALATEQNIKIEVLPKLNSDIKNYNTELHDSEFTVISDINKVKTMNDVRQDASYHIIETTKWFTELKLDIKVLNDPNNQSKIESMIFFLNYGIVWNIKGNSWMQWHWELFL